MMNSLIQTKYETKNKMKAFVLFCLLLSMIVPGIVYAEASPKYTLLEPLPCVGNDATTEDCVNGLTETVDVRSFVGRAFQIAIAFSVVASVIMIIWGGFLWATTDSISGKGEGKGKIQNALIGLLFALTSYLILYTIDPRLVDINVNLEKIKPKNPIDYALLNSTLDKISQMKADEIAKDRAEKAKIDDEISSIEEEIEALDSDYANGLIDEETYEREISKYNSNIKDLEAEKIFVGYRSAMQMWKKETLLNENISSETIEGFKRDQVEDSFNLNLRRIQQIENGSEYVEALQKEKVLSTKILDQHIKQKKMFEETSKLYSGNGDKLSEGSGLRKYLSTLPAGTVLNSKVGNAYSLDVAKKVYSAWKTDLAYLESSDPAGAKEYRESVAPVLKALKTRNVSLEYNQFVQSIEI